MNPGQEQFFNFILERVKEDKVEEAKALLAENFNKQDNGTFSHDDIMKTIAKMITLLRPDKVEEVQAIMKQFAGNFGQ